MSRHGLDLEKVGTGSEEELGAGPALDGFEGLGDGGADMGIGVLLAALESGEGGALANAPQGIGGGESQIQIVIEQGENEGFDRGLASVMEWFGEGGGAGFGGFDFADTGQDAGGGLAHPVFLVFKGGLELRGDGVGDFALGPVGIEDLQ